MKNGNLKSVIKTFVNGGVEPYTTPNGSLYIDNDVLYSYGSHFPLAFKAGSYFILNGDTYSNSTSKHQSYLIQAISELKRVEIPFSALSAFINNSPYNYYKGYCLDLKDLEQNLNVLDLTNDVWKDNGRKNKNGEVVLDHTLGACLIAYKGRFALSGIDETGKGKNRYFLTELVEQCETVSKAFQSLKPIEVIDAENKGQEVKRQGEYFFIPSKLHLEIKSKDIEKKVLLSNSPKEHHISTEGTYITKTNGTKELLVRGIIKHTGGDHKQIKLYEDVNKKEWYHVYKNIQVQSYGSFGNVD